MAGLIREMCGDVFTAGDILNMKKKAKKRYLTEDQILKDIDAWAKKAEKITAIAESMNIKAMDILRENPNDENAKFSLDQSDKLFRKAERIMEIKLKKLGVKLSVLRTRTMDFMEDASIPVS